MSFNLKAYNIIDDIGGDLETTLHFILNPVSTEEFERIDSMNISSDEEMIKELTNAKTLTLSQIFTLFENQIKRQNQEKAERELRVAETKLLILYDGVPNKYEIIHHLLKDKDMIAKLNNKE